MEFLRPKHSIPDIDMAPLIDCVFQLLTFFMLTSLFAKPTMKMTLPAAAARETMETDDLTVAIDRDGKILVNRTPVAVAELRAHLQEQLRRQARKQINLRGDADMPYRLFVQVMDLAKQAGAQQINIVHERAETHAP